MAKPIRELYEDIQRVKEGKLFKSAGRAGRLQSKTNTGTLRARSAATAASMDVRLSKTISGEQSPPAKIARLRQKAALKGLDIPKEIVEKRLSSPAKPVGAGSVSFGRLARLARLLGKVGSKTKILGVVPLPSQLEEYKQHMKPLSKKEQERSARGI